MFRKVLRYGVIPISILLFGGAGNAQYIMDAPDTSGGSGRGIFLHPNTSDYLRISGYIQPQFQWAKSAGISCYNGGDFENYSNNRFMLRRGRLRFDYLHYSSKKDLAVQFVFQFDGTEKGVGIRDFWGKISEQKLKVFSFTTGMFVRPFGYELNLASASRESPERGRMSQVLLKGERDLGAMISFEPKKNGQKMKGIKWDIGFFNGQGITASGDFDSRKDLISRLALKPTALNRYFEFSAAMSIFRGGFVQNTPYRYIMHSDGGVKKFEVDSSLSNLGKYAKRNYQGADFQIKFKRKPGLIAELRMEGIAGTQTATLNSSETPYKLLTGSEGYYVRSFHGVYTYLLYHVFNSSHQLAIKYDYYDPNVQVRKTEIGAFSSNLTVADICYQTFGFGYIYYMNPNTKLTAWYEWVKNEVTQISGYEGDIKDNLLTLRVQFRF